MLSTIKKELQTMNGVTMLVPKEYPNWYGIEDIGFIWNGAWSDPYLEFDGKVVNSFVIEDTMYERFKEDGGDVSDEDLFVMYMQDNKDVVKEMIILASEN